MVKSQAEQAKPDPGQKTIAVALPESRSVDIGRLRSSGFSFERLPATSEEVVQVQKELAPLGKEMDVRTGWQASRASLLATDLSRFRFLHFATHGILPSDVPTLSDPALVLSLDPTNPKNMFLTMSDVLKLKLNAEMVTLSACKTGLGRQQRAEGVIGLPRAFMFAGASSVVVSLWEVADESTAKLMSEFYKEIAKGQDKATALAAAKKKLKESEYSNPFYWAPFIMWGE